jgi:aryl-alcohol dehydrogenase-like predicted oxidoreductase
MGFEKVTLGRTGLKVSRLGIASFYGVDAAMVEEAAHRGANYFYWGALRTRNMANGIRKVAKTRREDIVIVMHTNARFGYGLPRLIQKNLTRLGIEYLDILLMGLHNKRPSQKLLDTAFELKEKGLVHWLGVSAHNRLIFREYEKEKLFDIFHVRYNAAHRGAEEEVFALLPELERPGIVSFTNTRWGGLLNPKNMPKGERPPGAADCYRFVLSHPDVDVAICGPNSMKQLTEDLDALEQGPMSEEEHARMRRIGDHVHTHVPPFWDNARVIKTIRWRGTR